MLRLLSSIDGHKQRAVLSVCAAPPGIPVVCSAGYDGAVRLWRVSRDNELHLAHELLVDDDGRSAGGAVFSVATQALPDTGGFMLCAGCYDRRMRVFRCLPDSRGSVDSPVLEWTSRAHTGWVRALATLATAATGGGMDLFSVGCNRILGWPLNQPASRGTGLPTDRQRAFEVALYEDEALVRSHDVLCLAHDAGAGRLASGNVDGTIRCWATGSERQVAQTDAGERGCAGGLGTTLDGSPVAFAARLPRAATWQAHRGRVASLAWHEADALGHEDGRRLLLSAGYDGLVCSWRESGLQEARDKEASEEEAWKEEVREEASEEAASEEEVARGEAGSGSGMGSRFSVGWELEAVRRVAVTGRALAVASGGAGIALCGTSEGELVALSGPELTPMERIALPDAGLEMGSSGSRGERRATAVAALPQELQLLGRRSVTDAGEFAAPTTFVVGDSDGRLHLVTT